jgi:competence protein ComEA
MVDPDAHRARSNHHALESELPPGVLLRPRPPRSPSERLLAWVAWFGLTRLVLTGVAVGAVAAGGFWLVRTPTPTAEANLPVVSASTPTATLPTPAVTGAAVGAAASGQSSVTSAPSALFVHVAGEVAVPGVYRLDPGGRVHEAIDRAGGATAEADLDALNLAQSLADGQRLYVPRTGEIDPGAIPVLTPIVTGVATATTAPPGPIDVNRATVAELEDLPGVGPATASAIVDDRERNGPFATVDDLDRVPGIGPSKLDALRDLVTV